MQISFIFEFAIIVISIVFHEVSHGYAAYFLGDKTAKYAGRLTLNPLKHAEIFGSVLMPILTHLIGGIIFGWAKPVPYNPYNLRHGKKGELIVALAGPFSNLILAIFFGLVLRFTNISGSGAVVASLIVLVNLNLAIFNLMPIPPLDGFKIITNSLSPRLFFIKEWIEKNTIMFIVIFLVLFSLFFDNLLKISYLAITGDLLR